MAFYEIRFPTDISLGSRGGPRRRTIVIESGSGAEERNSQWAASRRRYQAGYGVKNIDDLDRVIHFFEEMRGRLHSFRWKDHRDFKSCNPTGKPSPTDVVIGTGDNSETDFQLVKTYGSGQNNYSRTIKKPVAGTVRCALDGTETTAFTVDATTGIVTFTSPPGSSVVVTAGFEFDVPVRFDSDEIDVDLQRWEAGAIPDIPVIEVRL